jgi:hypothetical protein
MTTDSEREARRERPRSSHTASKRSGNLRAFSAWNHRCYLLQPRKFNGAGAWKATSVFPALAEDLPASFLWTAREDREGLKKYIDALLTSRRSESIYFEKAGLVEEIEMPSIARPEDTKIRANVWRFVDFMTLRDACDIPLWGKVHFITDGHNVVPIEFLAAVMQLFDPEAKRFYNPKADWWHCRESDLERMGLRPEDITSGMYRQRYQQPSVDAEGAEGEDVLGEDDVVDTETGSVDETPTPQTTRATTRKPPSPVTREISVTTAKHAKHADVLTLAQPKNGPPYYVRRMITYQGQLLWAATSYHPDGPWNVSHRDAAMLLALGVDEP